LSVKRQAPQPALCTNHLLRPRIWPSFRASSGCWPLRRTVQVRLGANLVVPRDGCSWHAHLRALATSIHDTSGLVEYLRIDQRLGKSLVYKEGDVANHLPPAAQVEVVCSRRKVTPEVLGYSAAVGPGR
jgi:hypothetical protein